VGILSKNVIITSELKIFQISGIFPTCFGCFLPANTNKNRRIIQILLNHFCAIFKVSRPVAYKTETRKNGSRDSITDKLGYELQGLEVFPESGTSPSHAILKELESHSETIQLTNFKNLEMSLGGLLDFIEVFNEKLDFICISGGKKQ